jgi:maltooligosyltrehalose trehalohydrolase
MISHQQRHHGARQADAGITHFSLWAPDAKRVDLLRPDAEPQPLQAQEDGWFSLERPCPAGTLYRYRIDGELEVPDPASRRQVGGVHGYSEVVAADSYPWQQSDWQGRPWHEAVIYEVHLGAAGGCEALIQDLPRLAALGITAIELMPLAEFPGTRGWGYDGVLPYAPSAHYGSPDQLKHLIDEAHSHGLMVYLDVVYNHFGPEGNYLGSYASPFFRHDLRTPWGDAIDFRRPQVCEFFIQNALMWLFEYRFDGLRLDAVHAISEQDFLLQLAQRVRAAAGSERQIHLTLENEDNSAALLEQGFDAQWNDDGHNSLHVLLTGESQGYYAEFQHQPIAQLARCLSEGFVYQGQPTRHGRPRGEPSSHLPPTAFVLFLQNHDQIGNRAFGERLINLIEPAALRAATALLLLSPMPPLLFMGEDWGAREPFLYFTDHKEPLASDVCRGRRAEFAEFAAFSEPAQRERIPDPNALQTFLASKSDPQLRDQPEHAVWQDFYRQLLHLRRLEIVPRLPGSQALGVSILSDKALCARWRLGDGQVLCIELNLAADPLPSPSAAGPRRLLCCTVEPQPHEAAFLPGHCARVSLESGDE